MKSITIAFFLFGSAEVFAANRPSVFIETSDRPPSRPADIQVKPASVQSFLGFRNTRIDPRLRHVQNEHDQLRNPSASRLSHP